MKAFWLIKNRRGRRGSPRFSMFPLLAVLICAMGALVLLLLSVTREARLQAVHEAAAKNAEKQSSIAAEMEMAQWRVEQLKKSRKETEVQLAEARLVLGHIEDHGRRLRDQFQELSRQARKAADEGLKAGRFVAAGEAELRQIEGRIAEVQQRLAQTRQAVANRPKSYAIVPYDGPNHTRRRPIYIECRGDAVVLQPENIVFNEADFDEPLGPGNPLAAAIRAAREQMLLEGKVDPQNGGEPYPLLLVRPAGIPAYDCALAAMKSWGSEFGYELINEDWQLKYPPPDPTLAKSVAQAVFLARQEHARLIAAAPSKYGKRPRIGSYRSPTGGELDEQGRAGEAESPGFYSSKPADRYARDAGGGSSATRGTGNAGRSQGSGGFGGGGEGNGSSGTGSGSSFTPSSDAEFDANNPYRSLPVPGVGGSPGVIPGGAGNGSGYGPGNGMGGAPGPGVPGGMAGSPGVAPGGVGNGSGYGPGNGMGGAPGSGVPGGMAGSPTMIPGGMGNGSAYGPGNGMSGVPGSGVPGGMADSPSVPPGGVGNGSGYGPGNGPGNGMGGVPGSGVPGGMAGSPGVIPGGVGNGSGYGPGNGMGGALGSGVPGGAVGSPNMNPGGSGNALAGGPAGSPTTNPGSPAYNYAPVGSPGAVQPDGQPTGGSASAAAVVRPDGYINGRPNDGNPMPPPVRPDASSSMAMAPAAPLRPGEWRPSEEPPKRDPDQEAKDKAEKKKHPYDKVKMDHDQNDWALRNATRHAAAISRPIHVDCYPDRVVLVPEAGHDVPMVGGEPHVILCDNYGRRDADKLVAAVWEIMDTWGMAGREMYWRPVLNFYVAPGTEPRMLDLTRSLEGSGLVIERKQ